MRFRLFLSLASASFLSAGLCIEACGGDSATEPSPTPDSSVAADTSTPPHDASTADTADAAPACDPNKDYLSDIPDASIADGASTTSECVTCVKGSCDTQIMACGQDCTCQTIAANALECFAEKQSITACAPPVLAAPPATAALGQNLLTCVTSHCKTECALDSLFPDAGDGG